MTEEQFEKIVVHLFEKTSVEMLAKAPGIGKKKAQEFKKSLLGKKEGGSTQTGIGEFPTD